MSRFLGPMSRFWGSYDGYHVTVFFFGFLLAFDRCRDVHVSFHRFWVYHVTVLGYHVTVFGVRSHGFMFGLGFMNGTTDCGQCRDME